MSKIKNGGLDQYGKVYSITGISGERVNELLKIFSIHFLPLSTTMRYHLLLKTFITTVNKLAAHYSAVYCH